MTALITLHNRLFDWVTATLAPVLVPTAARLVFAGVLLVYFWSSAFTKLGAGLFGFLHPSVGAYAQIFPKAIDAVGYDADMLPLPYHIIATLGMWAEFTLPLLITLGLATRLAALGMTGFIAVQSFVDITGHGVAGDDIGRWFDAASGALILDQRAFWVLTLLTLAMLGGGPLSLDRALRQWASG
ncbi:MAG: DoxX family membrane protein [Rhodobacteraceae bacterium]|nr:DoxX family membrane protein [Paracoccaceae bacterium]